MRNEQIFVPTGIAELDQALGGGLRRGTLTLIYGTGAYGVTLLTQTMCLAALRAQDKIVWYPEMPTSLDWHMDNMGVNEEEEKPDLLVKDIHGCSDHEADQRAFALTQLAQENGCAALLLNQGYGICDGPVCAITVDAEFNATVVKTDKGRGEVVIKLEEYRQEDSRILALRMRTSVEDYPRVGAAKRLMTAAEKAKLDQGYHLSAPVEAAPFAGVELVLEPDQQEAVRLGVACKTMVLRTDLSPHATKLLVLLRSRDNAYCWCEALVKQEFPDFGGSAVTRRVIAELKEKGIIANVRQRKGNRLLSARWKVDFLAGLPGYEGMKASLAQERAALKSQD